MGYFPFPFRKHKADEVISTLLEERKSTIKQLKSWLLDTSETFIVVQGPRGSGKRELVLDHVLPKRKNLLIIDCEPITEAHGDTNTIAAAAQQVGYRPVFSWMNTITSLADLAAQGTIGTSVGFSQTLEIQFNKILQNVGTALKQIALEDRSPQDKDAGLSDEEYLSANPEKRPVVVIDNFLHSPEGTMIYDRLAAWGALLVSASIAHVIFLTNDVSFSKPLSKSLPDRVFRSVLLGDASPQSAKAFIVNQISAGSEARPEPITITPALERELDESIVVLGGRLTDLEALATRIRSGEGPRTAVEHIISASAAEIMKLYLSPSSNPSGGKSRNKQWTIEQAWYLITQLSSPPPNTTPDQGLQYTSLLLHPLFAHSGEDVLQSLQHSELITILSHPSGSGRPYSIRPGRPVYRASFHTLTQDVVLKAKMDMCVLKALIGLDEAEIKRCEEEMAILATLGGGKEVVRRMEYLGKRIGRAQERVEGGEKGVEGLKGIVRGGY